MTLLPTSLAFGLLFGVGATMAQAPSSAGGHGGHHAAAQSEPAELSEGEVVRVDAQARKLTLRHGQLKSLDMPPMTMIFRVKGENSLAPFKAGDKVLFRAERIKGVYHVTHIEKAP